MDHLNFPPPANDPEGTNLKVQSAVATAEVQGSLPPCCPPTPQTALAVHEDFLLTEIFTKSSDNDDQKTQLLDEDFSLMFAPSQPLASSKFIDIGSALNPEVPHIASTASLSFEIEDGNIFMPLSFQEFGY